MRNEIILYQPDSTLSLDVRVENETVWLNQAQMVDLVQSTKQNIRNSRYSATIHCLYGKEMI